MSIHVVGVAGLVVAFVIGTARPINLGALALVMTFLVGGVGMGEGIDAITRGFPVDLFVLLVGVTYLFGIASRNGTVEHVVESAAAFGASRRRWIPWIVFVVAAMPAMAGALGSAGVALLAPLAIRLAERHAIDRRMIGLMVVHGAGAGNFSPLNVLSAIVTQAMAAAGLPMSVATLFVGNLVYNVVLAAIAFVVFGGLRLGATPAGDRRATLDPAAAVPGTATVNRRLQVDQICTMVALIAVAIAAFGFGQHIGGAALTAAVMLHLCFPRSSAGGEKRIAWEVVLLVGGMVTYVAALERYGTVTTVGASIASLGNAHVVALLLCGVGAVTSAFASSAGILSALVPLAVPILSQGALPATGLVVALAISATVVDATPFSTVGALVVANTADEERGRVYRGLLAWGAVMVLTAPIVTWLVFVLPGS